MTRPIKIMQIGDGNFIRGFFDVTLEKMNVDFGIVSVAATPRGKTINILKKQNRKFTVLETGLVNGELVEQSTEVNVLDDLINPYLEWQRFLNYAKSPDLALIVSNTTEAGIYYQKIPFPVSCPASYSAKLTVFLHEYFLHFKGEKSLSVLPFELIENNGDRLKDFCLKHAEDWALSTQFKCWLKTQIFCNSLVDRIVTGKPIDYAGNDELYTVCEPYFLFVIDQSEVFKNWFDLNRSPFIFDKVAKYRRRKVAVLNGSHIILAAIGKIYGFKTVREAMEDKEVYAFIESITNDYTTRYDEDTDYQYAVFERFLNPTIEHRLWDIQLNELSKWIERVAPFTNSEIYYKAMVIGLWSMNPLKYEVRESDETLAQLTEIFEQFALGNEQPLQLFIEEIFHLNSKKMIPLLLKFMKHLEEKDETLSR